MARERTVRITILGDATGAQRAFRESAAAAGTFEAKIQTVGATFGSLGARIVALGAGLGIVAGAREAINAASDLNESISKTEVVFGQASREVLAFSQTSARSLGISQQAALEAAGTFGNLFTSMGVGRQQAADLSVNLVQLAADLASFNNRDPSEVLEKLRSGLVGETEPLRDLGVNLNAAAVEAKALELGLASASGEISEAAKIQARYAIILEQTKNAQGDFARTADQAANQERILHAQLADASAQLGQSLLPLWLDFVTTLNDRVVPAIDDVASALKRLDELMGGHGLEVLIGLLAGGKLLQTAAGLKGAVDTLRPGRTLPDVGGAAGVLNITANIVNVNGKVVSGKGGDALGRAGKAVPAAGEAAAATSVAATVAAVVGDAIAVGLGAPLAAGGFVLGGLKGAEALGITEIKGGRDIAGEDLAHQRMEIEGITEALSQQNVMLGERARLLEQNVLNMPQLVDPEIARQIEAQSEAQRRSAENLARMAANEPVFAGMTPELQRQISEWQSLQQSIATVQGAVEGLAAAYQANLGVQSEFSRQAGEYNSQLNAVKAAIEAVQQKQQEGIPLTRQEQELLDNSTEIIQRYEGGIRDATIAQGIAAASNGELMLAQDRLNQLQAEGKQGTDEWRQAMLEYQEALGAAADMTGEAESATEGQKQAADQLQDLVTTSVIPAIINWATQLGLIPDTVETRIILQTAAAEAELDRIRRKASETIVVPIQLQAGAGFGGGAGSAGVGMFASGGTVPRDMLALVGERGPELVVLPRGAEVIPNHRLPFAGAFASGGVIGGGSLGGLTAGDIRITSDAFDIGFRLGQDVIDGLVAAMSDGQGEITEEMEDLFRRSAQQTVGVWNDVFSHLPEIISGDFQRGMQREIDALGILLQAGSEAGLAPAILEGLQQGIDERREELQRIGDLMGTEVMQGMAAAIQEQQAIQSGLDLLSQVPDILSGETKERLERELADLRDELAVAQMLGMPQEIIDALQQQIEEREGDLRTIGAITAQAIAAGLIEETETHLGPDALASITESIGDAPEIVSDVIDDMIEAAAQGRVNLGDVFRLIPVDNDEAMVALQDQLKRLEEQYTVKLVEAIISGNDEMAASAESLIGVIEQLLQGLDDEFDDAVRAVEEKEERVAPRLSARSSARQQSTTRVVSADLGPTVTIGGVPVSRGGLGGSSLSQTIVVNVGDEELMRQTVRGMSRRVNLGMGGRFGSQ